MKQKILIIEDHEGVAIAIEHQLQLIGSFHVDQSRNVVQALKRFSSAHKHPYDAVLCDYDLGESTNGQQLLEYLRAEKRIPRRTGFIMITAEASYSSVASAVELAPDAYLLKPFTQAGLAQRLEFVLEKRKALKAVYGALDLASPDLAAAIAACNALVVAGDRFALEALKIKADCLIRQEQWGEAANVYDKIIAWRPTPWAEVGRARTLRLMGYPELAEEKLKSTLSSFPQFVAAYDEMASLESDRGETVRAQEILEQAHAIVPSNRRSRALGLMALENGDHEKASRFLKIVTQRDRHGLLRSTEDFFGLANALRQMNCHDQAMEVLDSITQHFPESRPLMVRKMAAEAITLVAANRGFDAKKRVRDALELLTEQMAPQAQLELAEACHRCGEVKRGNEIFIHVAENWQENVAVVLQTKAVMARTGAGAEAASIIDESLRELTKTNNEAARHMKAGHFDDAVNDMQKVAKRLLSHATIQANYVQALLKWVEHNAPQNLMSLPQHSRPRQHLALAREHLQQLAKIKADHPRLPPLQRLLVKLTGETDILKPAADDHASLDEACTMEIGE